VSLEKEKRYTVGEQHVKTWVKVEAKEHQGLLATTKNKKRFFKKKKNPPQSL
jgi:hypothetical protein